MRLVPSSLAGRLLAGSAVFTALALVFALVVMQHVLERFVTGQIDQRLDNKIVALASEIEVDADSTIRLFGDADGPPFDKPRHKSCWWVAGPKNALRTGWLRPGDFTPPAASEIDALPTPPPPPPSPPRPSPLDADEAAPPALTPAERPRTIEGRAFGDVPMHIRLTRRAIGGVTVNLLAAAPREAISHPLREAMTSIGLAVAALGIALVLAAFIQVRLGLRPLARLRADVAAVGRGARAELPADQPLEIAPLVTELNALLRQNAETLARARRSAANLAHSLKTPLATLSLALSRSDERERARLQDLVEQIERRVRHHLGRARAAALDGPARARTPLAARLADIAEALRKVHADKAVTLTITCPPDLAVACEPQDVDEMLGNLLDNAFKYTRSHVACDVRAVAARVEIAIGDDGPGLTDAEIGLAQQPGQRLDEQVPGHGFGLPITRELAGLYGGGLGLARGGTGLIVTLSLPRAL